MPWKMKKKKKKAFEQNQTTTINLQIPCRRQKKKISSIHFYLQNHFIYGSVMQKYKETFISAFIACEMLPLVTLVQGLWKGFLF